MRQHPDNMRRAADPAATTDSDLAALAAAIRGLEAELHRAEMGRLRAADRALSLYDTQQNVTAITLPRLGGRCRITRVVWSAPNDTLTLQLKGGLNSAAWSLVVAKGQGSLALGGYDDGGIPVDSSDVISLTTTGSAGTMSLGIFGERLPDSYAY